jgi:hypothetical protein
MSGIDQSAGKPACEIILITARLLRNRKWLEVHTVDGFGDCD